MYKATKSFKATDMQYVTQGRVYELKAIYNSMSNVDKSKIEMVDAEKRRVIVVNHYQLNNYFSEVE